MKYIAKIELPVEKSRYGNYVLSNKALNQMLNLISKKCNIVSVDWENGNCTATVEILSSVTLDSKATSLELFVRDVIYQNSGKN